MASLGAGAVFPCRRRGVDWLGAGAVFPCRRRAVDWLGAGAVFPWRRLYACDHLARNLCLSKEVTEHACQARTPHLAGTLGDLLAEPQVGRQGVHMRMPRLAGIPSWLPTSRRVAGSGGMRGEAPGSKRGIGGPPPCAASSWKYAAPAVKKSTTASAPSAPPACLPGTTGCCSGDRLLALWACRWRPAGGSCRFAALGLLPAVLC